jgi:hypothetical protein
LTQQLDDLFGSAVVRKSFFSLSSQDLAQMVAQAQAITPEYAPPNLDNFFDLILPAGADPDLALSLLGQLVGVVEYAYLSADPDDPVVGTLNPHFATQHYLRPAPDGIGVQAAWARGADGSGIRVVDLEMGWNEHEDLPKPIPLRAGTRVASSRFHGQAVLGIILAIDDNRGIAGISPAVTIDTVSIADRRNRRLLDQTADRIATTARTLPFGSVMLLEVQHVPKVGPKLPIESQRLEFEAVRLATSRGIVVVEAAGNGNFDLDTFTDADGKHTLNRTLPLEFRESGAIMVGASGGRVPHQGTAHSNFGSRIDCFAYGERIRTTGDLLKPDDPTLYWDPDREILPGRFGFGGTSGAAAIIAGVCALVQDLRTRLTPIGSSGKLGSFGMRDVLSRPQNCTLAIPPTERLAGMPDFAKILANEFHP